MGLFSSRLSILPAEPRVLSLLEREEQELKTGINTLELEVKPFEIVTLKLRF